VNILNSSFINYVFPEFFRKRFSRENYPDIVILPFDTLAFGFINDIFHKRRIATEYYLVKLMSYIF